MIASLPLRPLLGTHPLDSPVWFALRSRQRGLAVGHAQAQRFPPDIAPFGAIPDTALTSFQALARLTPRGGSVAIAAEEPVEPPEGVFTLARIIPLDQMVAQEMPPPPGRWPGVKLDLTDVPAMCELVEQTHPGPFEKRTVELGAYFGIRIDGQLVAMAGERLQPAGYTEISAVCTLPEYRGRGMSQELVTHLAQQIRQRGETPFLHVFTENAAAIQLYRKLGFQRRKTLYLSLLALPG